MEGGMQWPIGIAGPELLWPGEFQNWQVGMMSALATSTTFPSVPAFPTGGDAHWETENRTVWNEQMHMSEERELVYEISWITELGVWRRFLRFQRKVQN